MRLREASLLDFRNLSEVQLSFSPGVNLLLGGNGQGKTNLLEALNYPALGRSYRGARDEELIRFGAAAAHLSLDAEIDGGRTVRFDVGLERDGGRRLRVDGEPVRRKADLVGLLATVVFDPQTVGLVRDGPEARRRFLDQGLSMVDPDYRAHLQSVQRALRQKGRLLRDARRGFQAPDAAREELRAWNRELAAHAAPVCLARLRYAAELEPAAGEAYTGISGAQGRLSLAYRPQLEGFREGLGTEQLQREFLAEFDYIVGDEMRRGRCLAGPQLDDLEILLEGVVMRSFGSQGETRSAAVALKLAQGEVVRQRRHVHPILFFDDIFSELDGERSRRLQERTTERHQVFIATARNDDVAGWEPRGLRRWRVSAGGISELI